MMLYCLTATDNIVFSIDPKAVVMPLAIQQMPPREHVDHLGLRCFDLYGALTLMASSSSAEGQTELFDRAFRLKVIQWPDSILKLPFNAHELVWPGTYRACRSNLPPKLFSIFHLNMLIAGIEHICVVVCYWLSH